MLLQIVKRSLLGLFFITLCISGDILAQGQPFELDISTSLYGSTAGPLPFWLHTNQDGKVDSSSTNWINEISFRSGLFKTDNFNLDMGGNLVGRFSTNSTAFFSELYLKADWSGYRLSAGRFPDPIGLNNHELSVGSMMVSRNATPIPKISISTPEFLDVPYTNGHVQFKGMFSHGWLEKDRYVSHAWLHQKYAYLKINIGDFSAIGGAVHNLIWAGNHPIRGKEGRSLHDYLLVVFGQATKAERDSVETGVAAIGNSVGAYEFGLTYNVKQYKISLTRLFYLEDRPAARFRSAWDGVWGVNITLKQSTLIHALTYEHFNSKQQDSKGNTLGRARYYNNAIYKSGWTYNRRVIGIPVFTFQQESPLADGQPLVTNDIVVGHHIGVTGSINQTISYRANMTYTRNYGVNQGRTPTEELNLEERRADQFSWLLKINHELPARKHLSLSAEWGGDAGHFYPNAMGGMLGLVWSLQ